MDMTLVVGGGSPKKEDHQMGSARGAAVPNYASDQT